MNDEAIIQEGKRKGLSIKRSYGAFIIRESNGDVYVPRDASDLKQFVENYRPIDETSIANQIIDHTRRA